MLPKHLFSGTWCLPAAATWRLRSRCLSAIPLCFLCIAYTPWQTGEPKRTEGRAAGGGCNISGTWKQSTEDIGSTFWIFTRSEGNRYQAQEQGLSNASGTVVVTGNMLRLDWNSTLGYAGFYEWQLNSDCSRGEGRAVGTRILVGTRPSRIERAAQAARPAAAQGTRVPSPAATIAGLPPEIPGTIPATIPPTIPPAPAPSLPPATVAPVPSAGLPGITPSPVPGSSPSGASPGPGIGKPAGSGGDLPCSGPLSCGFCLGRGIRQKWIQLGGEKGSLGCPIATESEAPRSLQGTSGGYAEFRGGEGGYIFWHGNGKHAGKAYAIEGCFFKLYKSMGNSASWLGFPVSEIYDDFEGQRQDFEGGRIVKNAQSGACLVFPGNLADD